MILDGGFERSGHDAVERAPLVVCRKLVDGGMWEFWIELAGHRISGTALLSEDSDLDRALRKLLQQAIGRAA